MSENRPPPRRRIAGEAAPAARKIPAKKAPTTKAPAKKVAAKKAPAKKDQAKKSPAKKAAPAVNAASTEASAPAKKAPAKKAPAKSASAKKAPAKKAPAEKALASESTSAPVQVARRTPREKTRSERPTNSRVTTLAAAAAALLLVAGGAIAWLGFDHWRGGSGTDTADRAAVSTASEASEAIFSFAYDQLDEHATESKSFMTAKYAKEFDKIAPALTDIAPQRKVVVEAVTREAAVLPCGEECSATKTSVLVFLDQDRRIEGEDTSTVFGNRIKVDLVKSDDTWKVDNIRAL